MSKPVYKYKDYVDSDNIQIDQENGYRYLLYVPFKNSSKDKNVLVVMKNPSEADKNKSDKTVNNVLSFCREKYCGVYFANLYPYRETDSTKLRDFIDSDVYDQKMQRNSEILDALDDSVDDVIVAWGTNNAGAKCDANYASVIESFLSKLRLHNMNICAMRFLSSKNPWHPRNWEESYELELYEWK